MSDSLLRLQTYSASIHVHRRFFIVRSPISGRGLLLCCAQILCWLTCPLGPSGKHSTFRPHGRIERVPIGLGLLKTQPSTSGKKNNKNDLSRRTISGHPHRTSHDVRHVTSVTLGRRKTKEATMVYEVAFYVTRNFALPVCAAGVRSSGGGGGGGGGGVQLGVHMVPKRRFAQLSEPLNFGSCLKS